MRIIRFLQEDSTPTLAALTDDEKLYALPYQDFLELIHLADTEQTTALQLVQRAIAGANPLQASLEDLDLLVPVDAPEVWAAGVTYERSREARKDYDEKNGKPDAVTFYDKVYSADRPELFFKSTSARTVGPNKELYLRNDSHSQVPEPELALVINKKGEIVGYTIGNDLSCRDIEGENPLYLPQAKIWKGSCSIGPAIRLAESVKDPYKFQITCRIYRKEEMVFSGTASTGQLKRKLDELVSYLIRNNHIFDGTVLLTGTCIVPDKEFTLQDGDRVEIEITDIGVLKNPVKQL